MVEQSNLLAHAEGERGEEMGRDGKSERREIGRMKTERGEGRGDDGYIFLLNE